MNCRADLLAARVPVAARQLVGRVLAEDGHRVLALGRRARVEAGLRVDLGEADRGLAGDAALERGLGGVDPVGQLDHRPRRPGLAVGGGPVRELVERGVELDDRAAHVPLLEPLAVAAVEGVDRVGADQAQRDLRVGVRDDGARPGSGVPSSSSTPSPGTIRATGTPQASIAPASRAASAIAKLTIPIPPST